MRARDLLEAVAGNPALPPALVDRLIGDADEDLAGELAGRPDLTPAQVRELAGRFESAAVRLARGGLLDPGEVDAVAQPYAALALLDEGRGRAGWADLFAGDPDVKRRLDLAACPALPAEARARLAADPVREVVAELAIFTEDGDLLARLADHPHADVRAGVAVNPAAPPRVLAGLVAVHWRGSGGTLPESCEVCEREPLPFVHDPECHRADCDLPAGAACNGTHESVIHSLLCRVVDNPATPAVAAAELAGHPSPIVRWQLAARPDLPADVAAVLAGDPVPNVRAHLAENPALPAALFAALAEDRYDEVRRRLAHNPHIPLALLARPAKGSPVLLPRIAAAGPDEVRELAGSPYPRLRMLVAERRDLVPEIRDRLAADPDAKVLKSVAPHPGLPEELLRDMVSGHGARVIGRIATNPDASAGLLYDLARHAPPVPKALREIARHPEAPAAALELCLADARARPVAAGHPNLPAGRIVELLTDPEGRVATAAAANPALPESEMDRLCAASGPVP